MTSNIPLDNPALQALRHTRQVRQFTDEPLSDDQLTAILEQARWTGSAVNRQPWTFVVVRDKSTLDALADLAPHAHGVPTSSATIAIGMEPGQDPDWDPFDEGRASERMLVAATALGLAASVAWVRPEYRRRVAEMLGLPAPHYVRTLVSVGHPTAEAAKPKSAPGEARKPLGEIVRQAPPH